MANLLATKPLDTLMKEASESGEHSLKRALGPVNLITLGIGAIIGAGIFVLTGHAAAANAGPAIVFSLSSLPVSDAPLPACVMRSSLRMIPIAGSAYTYGYATLGEFFAWIIGWDLILEYAFGAATVASGWSGTVVAFLQNFGINLASADCRCSRHADGLLREPLDTAGDGAEDAHRCRHRLAYAPHATAVFNLVAFLGIALVTTILVIGTQESANFNTVMVFIKAGRLVLIFIAVAGNS